MIVLAVLSLCVGGLRLVLNVPVRLEKAVVGINLSDPWGQALQYLVLQWRFMQLFQKIALMPAFRDRCRNLAATGATTSKLQN